MLHVIIVRVILVVIIVDKVVVIKKVLLNQWVIIRIWSSGVFIISIVLEMHLIIVVLRLILELHLVKSLLLCCAIIRHKHGIRVIQRVVGKSGILVLLKLVCANLVRCATSYSSSVLNSHLIVSTK